MNEEASSIFQFLGFWIKLLEYKQFCDIFIDLISS